MDLSLNRLLPGENKEASHVTENMLQLLEFPPYRVTKEDNDSDIIYMFIRTTFISTIHTYNVCFLYSRK